MKTWAPRAKRKWINTTIGLRSCCARRRSCMSDPAGQVLQDLARRTAHQYALWLRNSGGLFPHRKSAHVAQCVALASQESDAVQRRWWLTWLCVYPQRNVLGRRGEIQPQFIVLLVIARKQCPARPRTTHEEFRHEHLLDSQSRLESLIVVAKRQFVPTAHTALSSGGASNTDGPSYFWRRSVSIHMQRVSL